MIHRLVLVLLGAVVGIYMLRKELKETAKKVN